MFSVLKSISLIKIPKPESASFLNWATLHQHTILNLRSKTLLKPFSTQ